MDFVLEGWKEVKTYNSNDPQHLKCYSELNLWTINKSLLFFFYIPCLKKNSVIYKIWSFHGGVYKECRLLESDAVLLL
jgi:hypothetical protein